MKKIAFMMSVLIGVLLPVLPAAAGQEAPPWAVLDALSGDVKIAVVNTESWAPAQAKMALGEKQVVKTGPQSQASIRFAEGALSGVVGENTRIALQDLLLKARLEKMRGRIAPPGDTKQTQMQVTPLTGVRGTDEADSKAEEPKREHHWEENATGQ